MFGCDIHEKSLEVLKLLFLSLQVLLRQKHSFLEDNVDIFLGLLQSPVAVDHVEIGVNCILSNILKDRQVKVAGVQDSVEFLDVFRTEFGVDVDFVFEFVPALEDLFVDVDT